MYNGRSRKIERSIHLTIFRFTFSQNFIRLSESRRCILLDDSERPINCLLYADDLVIFSRSANGLQTLLNKLESYCEKTELTVNLDKTKVMIFNNCGKSLNNYSFKYGVNKLNNVKSYKYLGMTQNPYGNFSLAREELKKSWA